MFSFWYNKKSDKCKLRNAPNAADGDISRKAESGHQVDAGHESGPPPAAATAAARTIEPSTTPSDAISGAESANTGGVVEGLPNVNKKNDASHPSRTENTIINNELYSIEDPVSSAQPKGPSSRQHQAAAPIAVAAKANKARPRPARCCCGSTYCSRSAHVSRGAERGSEEMISLVEARSMSKTSQDISRQPSTSAHAARISSTKNIVETMKRGNVKMTSVADKTQLRNEKITQGAPQASNSFGDNRPSLRVNKIKEKRTHRKGPMPVPTYIKKIIDKDPIPLPAPEYHNTISVRAAEKNYENVHNPPPRPPKIPGSRAQRAAMSLTHDNRKHDKKFGEKRASENRSVAGHKVIDEHKIASPKEAPKQAKVNDGTAEFIPPLPPRPKNWEAMKARIIGLNQVEKKPGAPENVATVKRVHDAKHAKQVKSVQPEKPDQNVKPVDPTPSVSQHPCPSSQVVVAVDVHVNPDEINDHQNLPPPPPPPPPSQSSPSSLGPADTTSTRCQHCSCHSAEAATSNQQQQQRVEETPVPRMQTIAEDRTPANTNVTSAGNIVTAPAAPIDCETLNQGPLPHRQSEANKLELTKDTSPCLSTNTDEETVSVPDPLPPSISQPKDMSALVLTPQPSSPSSLYDESISGSESLISSSPPSNDESVLVDNSSPSTKDESTPVHAHVHTPPLSPPPEVKSAPIDNSTPPPEAMSAPIDNSTPPPEVKSAPIDNSTPPPEDKSSSVFGPLSLRVPFRRKLSSLPPPSPASPGEESASRQISRTVFPRINLHTFFTFLNTNVNKNILYRRTTIARKSAPSRKPAAEAKPTAKIEGATAQVPGGKVIAKKVGNVSETKEKKLRTKLLRRHKRTPQIFLGPDRPHLFGISRTMEAEQVAAIRAMNTKMLKQWQVRRKKELKECGKWLKQCRKDGLIKFHEKPRTKPSSENPWDKPKSDDDEDDDGDETNGHIAEFFLDVKDAIKDKLSDYEFVRKLRERRRDARLNAIKSYFSKRVQKKRRVAPILRKERKEPYYPQIPTVRYRKPHILDTDEEYVMVRQGPLPPINVVPLEGINEEDEIEDTEKEKEKQTKTKTNTSVRPEDLPIIYVDLADDIVQMFNETSTNEKFTNVPPHQQLQQAEDTETKVNATCVEELKARDENNNDQAGSSQQEDNKLESKKDEDVQEITENTDTQCQEPSSKETPTSTTNATVHSSGTKQRKKNPNHPPILRKKIASPPPPPQSSSSSSSEAPRSVRSLMSKLLKRNLLQQSPSVVAAQPKQSTPEEKSRPLALGYYFNDNRKAFPSGVDGQWLAEWYPKCKARVSEIRFPLDPDSYNSPWWLPNANEYCLASALAFMRERMFLVTKCRAFGTGTILCYFMLLYRFDSLLKYRSIYFDIRTLEFFLTPANRFPSLFQMVNHYCCYPLEKECVLRLDHLSSGHLKVYPARVLRWASFAYYVDPFGESNEKANEMQNLDLYAGDRLIVGYDSDVHCNHNTLGQVLATYHTNDKPRKRLLGFIPRNVIIQVEPYSRPILDEQIGSPAHVFGRYDGNHFEYTGKDYRMRGHISAYGRYYDRWQFEKAEEVIEEQPQSMPSG